MVLENLNQIIEESNENLFATSADELTKQVIYFNKKETSNNLTKKLRILHFNDVYNIEPSSRDPKGGAARFLTAINYLRDQSPAILLFSGDIFSPSPLSMITKGKQMAPILNRFQVDVACVGNHDFDFGIEVLNERIEETTFPWLISNVFDAETKNPITTTNTKQILEFNEIKIGVIGLVEQEWMETLSTIDFDDIIYESFTDIGKKLAIELKEIDKVDYVIALTHMRLPNDLILVEDVPEIDIVLGGHDHNYVCESVNDRWVVKSGTDFREISLIEMSTRKSDNKSCVMRIERYVIDSRIPEDEDLKSVVEFYLNQGEKDLDKVLGYVNTDLDGRFSVVRSGESNLGNFICDIILQGVNADCSLINSGTLRSDCITPAGPFTLGDLKKIIPFPDPIILIECDGKTLHFCLENAVSMYPKLEGRFPQVAGIEFAFDPSKPSGHRIDPRLIKIQDEYLDYQRIYKLATKSYIKDGKDGYTMFGDCSYLIDDEDGPLLFSLVHNHFENIKKVKELPFDATKRPSLVPIVRKSSIIKDLLSKKSSSSSVYGNLSENDISSTEELSININSTRVRRESRKLSLKQSLNLTKESLTNIKKSDAYIRKLSEYEDKSIKLNPKIEGRIICIKDKSMYEKLLLNRQEYLNTQNFENQLVFDYNSL